MLGVGSDHVVHLYDRKGKELAKLDKPKLRPAALRVALEAEGGPRVFALTAGEFDKTGHFAVEVLIPPIAQEEIAAFSPLKARAARLYNRLCTSHRLRWAFLLVAPFFRVVGRKPKAWARPGFIRTQIAG